MTALMIAFLFITLSQFRQTLNDSLRERAYTMLTEATMEQAQSLRAQLANSGDTLAAFAIGLSQLPDPLSRDNVAALTRLVREGGFRLAGLAAPNGDARTSDGRSVNIADRDYFKASMAGERGIEIVSEGRLDPRPLLILSAPVQANDDTIGVIYASYDVDTFGAMMSVASFGGDEYAYIIDTSLRVLAQSGNARPLSGVAVVGDVWTDAARIPELTPVKLRNRVRDNEGGRFTSSLSGEIRHVAFAPLGIMDWVLLCVLPESALTREYGFFPRQMETLSLLLSIGALALLCYIVISGAFARKKIAASFNELSFLNDSLPGGVFRARMAEGFPLDYISGQLCAITGRSPESLGTLLTLLDPRDAERTVRHLRSALQETGQATAICRLRGLDGVVRSMNVQCRFENALSGNPREGQFIYGILLDVSERVAALRALSQALQKYEIALAHTPLTVLEYDFATRTLCCATAKESPLSLPREVVDAPTAVCQQDFIAEESVSTLREAFQRMVAGEPHVCFEARLRVRDGGYPCFRVDMTSILDDEGALASAMLLLQNIEREKDAERDALTGLLNRAGAESRVAALLADSPPDAQHAFLYMDIDHFKAVNDALGHHAGDEALRAFAAALIGAFRSGDVVARLGGDEFCVLMRDVRSEDLPLDKARAVHEALCAAEGDCGSLTFSAGVSFYPKHGRGFHALAEAADRALYRAKEEGRDRVRLAE